MPCGTPVPGLALLKIQPAYIEQEEDNTGAAIGERESGLSGALGECFEF
jgi:hypothetical protein